MRVTRFELSRRVDAPVTRLLDRVRLRGWLTSNVTSMNDMVQRWRADTPGCEHRNHLNNAGAALMPRAVLDAMQNHLQLESTIGGYEAADASEGEIERVYDAIAELVGARARNMAIVGSATAGFTQAVSTIDFQPGETIVTTKCDYTSYQIQYLALAERRGVQVLHAEDLPEGGVDPESVRALVRQSRCRLVSVSWVPTNSGLVQDAAAVGAVCEELGVPYHLDACQAVGQIPIDISALRCDYLSVTARKFLRGPRGLGFLFVSDRALDRGDTPFFIDMRGARWTAPTEYEPMDSAHRFETWELPYAQVLGLGEAARYASAVGIPRARDMAFSLAARARRGLSAIPGVRALDRGRNPCAIVTVSIARLDAPSAVSALRERGINTSASLGWYGLYDFAEKGVDSAVRLSPHYYNTESEVDAAIEAIGQMAAGVHG